MILSYGSSDLLGCEPNVVEVMTRSYLVTETVMLVKMLLSQCGERCAFELVVVVGVVV